jgi:hypothetical protein
MTREDRIGYVIGGLQGAAMTLDHKLIGGQKEAIAAFLRELAAMLVEETRVLRDD